MRFAFYGRVSTEDQQDPQASKGWQLSRARSLIEPAGGEIVAEFFDIGQSRSLPWKRRPEALRLLDTIKSAGRDFDSVVIGEPQRAFYGSQFGMTFPVFVHYGVSLWVPEIGGAIDPGSDAHDLVMALYGGMSKGERNRIKVRVRSAMKAQTELEGRYLGGRPPYGYRLADAGPHPNPGKAAEGRRLHRLEPDPVTAPVVARIFNEYVAGRGMTSIARGLTQDGIACPSAYGDAGEIEKLRQTITEADRKINGYRATLDAGGDPTLIAGWIAETNAIKKTAQARLGLTEAPPQRLSADQLDAIAEAFNDLLGLLRDADPRDRAELYSRLGLRMTYRPGPETLMAEVVTPADLRVFDMCPEGDLNPHAR